MTIVCCALPQTFLLQLVLQTSLEIATPRPISATKALPAVQSLQQVHLQATCKSLRRLLLLHVFAAVRLCNVLGVTTYV